MTDDTIDKPESRKHKLVFFLLSTLIAFLLIFSASYIFKLGFDGDGGAAEMLGDQISDSDLENFFDEQNLSQINDQLSSIIGVPTLATLNRLEGENARFEIVLDNVVNKSDPSVSPNNTSLQVSFDILVVMDERTETDLKSDLLPGGRYMITVDVIQNNVSDQNNSPDTNTSDYVLLKISDPA